MKVRALNYSVSSLISCCGVARSSTRLLDPLLIFFTAFADDIKAHTNSFFNISIITMIFNDW